MLARLFLYFLGDVLSKAYGQTAIKEHVCSKDGDSSTKTGLCGEQG